MKNTTLPFEHVHEKFRHIVLMSNEDRLSFIDSPHWIGYTYAKKTLDVMQGLMNKVHQHRMPNLLIVGESNNGKTTILKQFYELYGGPYAENGEDLHMPVVSIQAPPTASEKDLYVALLHSFVIFAKSSDSATALRYQVIRTFHECHVKILIIDEIHSLLSGTARQQRQIMNCIKYLYNELQIPIVLAGTPEAVRILHTDPQHASRFDVLPLPVWGNDKEFRRMVLSFERVLPLKKPSNLADPEKLNLIYTISDGRIGNVKRLINECAIEAINSGKEMITLQMIKDRTWLRPTQGIRNLI